MRALDVLDPDQGRRGVDDRIQIKLRKADIPFQLEPVKQLGETERKRRRSVRPGPDIVDLRPEFLGRVRGKPGGRHKNDDGLRFGRATDARQAFRLPGIQKNDVVVC